MYQFIYSKTLSRRLCEKLNFSWIIYCNEQKLLITNKFSHYYMYFSWISIQINKFWHIIVHDLQYKKWVFDYGRRTKQRRVLVISFCLLSRKVWWALQLDGFWAKKAFGQKKASFPELLSLNFLQFCPDLSKKSKSINPLNASVALI